MPKTDVFDPIPFVKAGSSSEPPTKNSKRAEHLCASSGAETRKFYEQLVTEDFSKQTHNNPSKNAVPLVVHKTQKTSEQQKQYERSTTTIKPVTNNQFLAAAQNGNLKHLELCLDSGVDINVTDKFGWTALMCAAFSGLADIVSSLLSRGANKDILNSNGDTAISLARLNKRQSVVSLLDPSRAVERIGAASNHIRQQRKRIAPTFHCAVCRCDVTGVEESVHNASTVHLINLNVKPSSTAGYTIPESNRGFQLMLKHGWNKEHGLGSEGQGQKYPVKTILKRDRKGFAASDELQPSKHQAKAAKSVPKAKVTHFGANDQDAVAAATSTSRQLRATTLKKRQLSRKLLKDKERERAFRREFY